MSAINFNKNEDKIAVVVKQFTLLKHTDFFLDRYNEPYILSFAIDQNGAANPAIDFNMKSFPNIKKDDTVSFDGQGHLIYGPKNPGEFVVYTVLFMECDRDIREVGDAIKEIAKSEAMEIGMKAMLAANPTYGTALTLLDKLTGLVAERMKKNRDDELFRRNGTLLRDVLPPYDILRTYKSKNDYIETHNSIIPLPESNMLGSQIDKLKL